VSVKHNFPLRIFWAFCFCATVCSVSYATQFHVTVIPDAPSGYTFGEGRSISNNGQIVSQIVNGHEGTAILNICGLSQLHNDGTISSTVVDLSYGGYPYRISDNGIVAPGGYGSVVGTDVNNAGEIAVAYAGQASVCKNGVRTPLETGGKNSMAAGINNLGQIVGYVGDARQSYWQLENGENVAHTDGVVWDDNGTVLATINPGGDFTWLTDISDNGKVVGQSFYADPAVNGHHLLHNIFFTYDLLNFRRFQAAQAARFR
jgi:uncharacterized membrane protein